MEQSKSLTAHAHTSGARSKNARMKFEPAEVRWSKFGTWASLGMAAFLTVAPAQADDFPSRPMTLVIPFAAGGPSDFIGRVIAARMGEILGQNVIVENVPGAGGMVGSKRIANASPDGYEFGLGTVGTHAESQTLYKKPLYNAVTDFTPVILIANVPLVLEVRKDLPVSNFREFVAYTKMHQAEMQYGSAGSAAQLGCVLLNYLIGVKVTSIPYRGSAPALQDLEGGRIDYMCDIMTTAKPPIDAGAVKGLAVMDSERSSALPEIPTAAEQGTRNLVAYTWNAIFLPKNAPEVVVKKLHDAALGAMHTPSVRDRLTLLGAKIAPDSDATPQYLAKLVKSEITKWAVPIKAAGVIVK